MSKIDGAVSAVRAVAGNVTVILSFQLVASVCDFNPRLSGNTVSWSISIHGSTPCKRFEARTLGAALNLAIKHYSPDKADEQLALAEAALADHGELPA